MPLVDSLQRMANARNVSFRISLRWPIHIINPVDKTKLSFSFVLSLKRTRFSNEGPEIKVVAPGKPQQNVEAYDSAVLFTYS